MRLMRKCWTWVQVFVVWGIIMPWGGFFRPPSHWDCHYKVYRIHYMKRWWRGFLGGLKLWRGEEDFKVAEGIIKDKDIVDREEAS